MFGALIPILPTDLTLNKLICFLRIILFNSQRLGQGEIHYYGTVRRNFHGYTGKQ